MIPIITVSDKRPEQDYYCYDEFFESLRRFGHETTVLGFGEPYKGMMNRLKRVLANLLTIDAPVVIVTDCWDVLFLRSPEDIVERFKEFGVPIVISSERTLFPAKDYGEYPPGETDSRYLNAGFIVAEREAMISLLEHLKVNEQPDDFQIEDGSWKHFIDQELLHHAFVEQFVPIKLDYRSVICQSMFKTLPGEINLSGYKPANTLMNSFPMVLHWNGPAKTEALVSPADGVKWWREHA